MDENRFFRAVNRINSLLILIGAGCAVVLLLFLASIERGFVGGNTVEVENDSAENGVEKLELRLGNLVQMTGHNIQSINLYSESTSRGYKSGYPGSNIRNVVFLIGDELESKWLYDQHGYLITCFCKLKENDDYAVDEPVLSLYVSVAKKDTNRDGVISADDDITLALLDVDGSNYTEVASGITKVFDSTVSEDGKVVSFLLHIGDSIVVHKYSLSNFDLLSERLIDEISKKI